MLIMTIEITLSTVIIGFVFGSSIFILVVMRVRREQRYHMYKSVDELNFGRYIQDSLIKIKVKVN